MTVENKILEESSLPDGGLLNHILSSLPLTRNFSKLFGQLPHISYKARVLCACGKITDID